MIAFVSAPGDFTGLVEVMPPKDRYWADPFPVRTRDGRTFLFFEAAPYLRAGESVLGLLERCLDRGVLLTPGASCGRDTAGWLRLCFTTLPPAELEEALERLVEVLSPEAS